MNKTGKKMVQVPQNPHPVPMPSLDDCDETIEVSSEGDRLLDILSCFEYTNLRSSLQDQTCLEHYYTLVNCYPNCNIIDLLNLIKINRLCKSRFIPEEICDDLRELYVTRIEKLGEDNYDIHEIDEIDKELEKYDISPYMTIKDLIDDDVYNNGIDRNLNIESTKKLIKKIRKD